MESNNKVNATNVFSQINTRIKSMVITAILLALYLLFAYIGNQFFNLTFLSSFLNLDISLVFLIPLVFICSWQWWLFAGICGGLFNFLWAGAGGWIGTVFNVVSNTILLSLIYVLKLIIFKLKFKSKAINQKNKYIFYKISLISLVSFFLTIVINCILNGLIFTPLYWNLYAPQIFNTISFIEIAKIYNNNEQTHIWLLGINNYTLGIISLYSAFNAIKFGLVFLLVTPLLIFLYKWNIINKYFLKKQIIW